MSLRVLHVVPAIAARYGGPSAAAIGMSRCLADVGCAATIVTTDADGAGRLDVPVGKPAIYQDVPAIFFRRAGSEESFKWSFGLAAWLHAHVAEYDVVHVHAVFSHSSLAAGRACRAHRVPYVVRPLGTLDPWSLRRHRIRKKAMFALGVRALLSGSAAMHYTSVQEGRLAESVVPSLPRGVVVPNGIDDEFFVDTPGSSALRPYVISASRLDPKKRIDVLIQAFHALAADDDLSAWQLLIAGDGEAGHVSMLKALAAAGPAAERIRFVGWLAGADKRRAIRDARVFALPSSQENFGISVAEALAAGVPAVVTPAVNLADDIVAARAGWVAAQQPEAFAIALRAAMRDDDRQDRSRRARDLAQAFRWSRVADQLVGLYEGLARSRQVA